MHLDGDGPSHEEGHGDGHSEIDGEMDLGSHREIDEESHGESDRENDGADNEWNYGAGEEESERACGLGRTYRQPARKRAMSEVRWRSEMSEARTKDKGLSNGKGQRTKSDLDSPAFPLILALSLVLTTSSLHWRRAVGC